MFGQMITTNKWGECYFKILPPDMKEPKPPHYQWRIGENIITPQDHHNSTHIYCFQNFLDTLDWPNVLRTYSFCMVKICWVGALKSTMELDGCQIIKSSKPIIYRVKTGEELRREDSPLYRIYITRLAILSPRQHKIVRFQTYYSEFDWLAYVLWHCDCVNLDLVPQVYRTSKYICIAVHWIAPDNKNFVVKDLNVLKALDQFTDIVDYTISIHLNFNFFHTYKDSLSVLSQVFDPKPVVAQRNLINWIVRAYNRKYNTDYSIPL